MTTRTVLLVLLIAFVHSTLSYACPEGNSTKVIKGILHEIYNSLGGAGWVDQHGWKGQKEVSYCSWTGIGCEHADIEEGGNPAIRTLVLTRNNLTGTIPEIMSCLQQLETIDLSYNYISGTLPSSLFLNNFVLKYLYLDDNLISGALPSSMRDLRKLVSLQIRNNLLNHTLPAIRSSTLSVIALRNNSLTGSIPTGISQLWLLSTLDLSYNQLHGMIPTNLSRLPHLNNLDVSHNQLSGPIPPNWTISVAVSPYNGGGHRTDVTAGGMESTRITTILLNNNNLNGTIPANIRGLFVDLSSNKLTGPLPNMPWLCSPASNIRLFNVSGNDIMGTIPPLLKVQSVLQRNYKQCGFLSCAAQGANTEAQIITPTSYNSELTCICSEGYFGINGSNCLKCSTEINGCQCLGDVIQHCYPVVVNNTLLEILPCPQWNMLGQCNPKAYHWPHPSWCKAGYTGLMCSKCDINYFLLGRHCVACTYAPFFYPLLLISFVLFCAVTLIVFTGDQITGMVKIFTFYIQTVGLTFADRLGLTNDANRAIQLITNATILSPTSFHLECVSDSISFCVQVILNVVTPIMYILVVAVIFCVGLFWQVCRGKLPPVRWKERCINMLIGLMQLYYFPLTLFVIRGLSCTATDQHNEVYLNFQPWIKCNFNDPNFPIVFIISVVGLLVFVIGFPIVVFMRIRYWHRLEEWNSESAKTELTMLTASYRENRWWWEFVVFLRSIILSLAIALPSYNGASIIQYSPPVLVLALFSALQMAYNPFTNNLTNRVSLFCLVFVGATFMLAVVLFFVYINPDIISLVIVGINAPIIILFVVLFFALLLYKRCIKPPPGSISDHSLPILVQNRDYGSNSFHSYTQVKTN